MIWWVYDWSYPPEDSIIDISLPYIITKFWNKCWNYLEIVVAKCPHFYAPCTLVRWTISYIQSFEGIRRRVLRKPILSKVLLYGYSGETEFKTEEQTEST